MSRTPINRRDALLASAGLAIAATTPPAALAQAPSSPAASNILKSQSLAPLMGAPVTLGKAENGAIVNQAALDAHAKTFVPRRETVKVTDNVWMIEDPSASEAFIVGNDGVIV